MNKPKTIHTLKRGALFFALPTVVSLCGADQIVKYGKAEFLGQPCRSKQVLAGRVVIDRADGRQGGMGPVRRDRPGVKKSSPAEGLRTSKVGAAAVTHVTATRDGTVYISCETDVYRLRPVK